MPVLVLATSGAAGEVGLLAEGSLAVRRLGEGAARGRGLLGAVAALLAERGVARSDLEGIVVDRGPGSFTGVRVGVTTAKALAFALEIGVRAVTSLEALAAAAPADRPVLAVRDAGRGRVYAWRFGPADAEGKRPAQGSPVRAPLDRVLAAPPPEPGLLVAGEEASALLRAAGIPIDAADVRADAAAVLAAAETAGEAVPAHVLAPLYLQASAPERRRAGEKDEAATGTDGADRPS